MKVRRSMGATRTPRGRWVEEGLQALADGGPAAVRVEALAKKLGVTKGGFYGTSPTAMHCWRQCWMPGSERASTR